MVGPIIVYWIYEILIFMGYNSGVGLTGGQDQHFYLMSISFIVCHMLNLYVWWITFFPLILSYLTGGRMNAASSYGKVEIVQRTCYDENGIQTDCVS